jgi:hypothetical protein
MWYIYSIEIGIVYMYNNTIEGGPRVHCTLERTAQLQDYKTKVLRSQSLLEHPLPRLAGKDK